MVRFGVSPLIVGHVVNHRGTTKAGMTLAVYVQYSFDKEKREAFELWANKLAAIVSGGAAKVIHMRAAIGFDPKSRHALVREYLMDYVAFCVAWRMRRVIRE